MKLNKLISNFVNRDNHPRVKGRYNSSELFNICKGKVTPKNFNKPRNIDDKGVQLISRGIASEDYLTKVFTEMEIDCESQAKKVIDISEGITLVAKLDFLFKDRIIEVKHPSRTFTEIPPWYQYQCEAYYRAYNLPVYVWEISEPFNITQLVFTPSQKRWDEIQEKLITFHKKLCQLRP